MTRSDHVERQRLFYDTREHAHLQPHVGDFYAHKLALRLATTAGLTPEHRVLEIGAGFGRFTFSLLERCGEIVALDLSEQALDTLTRMRDARGIAPARCATLRRDVYDLTPELAGDGFDAVVGFFLLHHLPDLGRAIDILARLVKPGGRVIFLEPNRRNPLFALQVLACADMTWREEKGMFQLSARKVEAAYRAAGLRPRPTETFGFFPPQVLNHLLLSRRLEAALERLRPLASILPLLLLGAEAPATVR